jgi:replication-associated recombination protein RarA
MGSRKIETKQGYDFFEATSAMQKAIRRNDPKIAGYFALELYHSGYYLYVWKRLLTISAEDCYGDTITTEVYNLYRSFMLINDGRPDVDRGRIFISKAVLILCRTPKSRDADHLQNLVYDKNKVSSEGVDEIIRTARKENLQIPDYAFDIHTKKGRYLGKTKKAFFLEEYEALRPRVKGLFDDLVGGEG